MKVLTGDETGLLKEVSLEENSQTYIDDCAVQKRENGIEKMIWYPSLADAEQTENSSFVVAHRNGIIQEWDYKTKSSSWKFSRFCTKAQKNNAQNSKLIGMDVLKQYGSIVTCNELGEVHIHNPLCSESNPAKSYSSPKISIGRDVSIMRTHSTSSSLGFGGKERDLNIWDLETQKAVFKAKNVPHDKLDMREPVWVKDLCFFNSYSGDGHKVILGTGYHELRIYDTKAKRRPVVNHRFGTYPIHTLCLSPDENQIIFADTSGCVDTIDIRTMKHLGRFIGPSGSIRSIQCHPVLPYVACVGLDRFVHVYDTKTRKKVHEVYMKQRLNSVLFTDELISKVKSSSEVKQNDDEDSEIDDIVESMQNGEGENYVGLEISDGSDFYDSHDDE